MDITIFIFILLAIFLGALVRTYFGFGEALISMPLLALIGLDIKTAISLVGIAGLTVALFNIFSEMKHIKYRTLAVMMTGSLIGIPVGIWILHHFDTGKIQLLLAIFLILYGIYAFIKTVFLTHHSKIKLKSSLWEGLAGLVSGVLGSVYNSHGVPIVIFGTLSQWHIKDFKSTIQAHFLLTAIFVVMGQLLGGIWTSQTIRLFLATLPILVVAVLLGKYLSKKTHHNHFEKWIYIFIVILGILMLSTQ
ncbi:sulfite exporter TauE/SafE family protein [Staphylococcus equorum]